jgi:hypothetical protein
MGTGNSTAMSSWKWPAKPNQTDSRGAAFREAQEVDSKVDHPKDADPRVDRHPKDADQKVDRHLKVGAQRECKVPIPNALSTKPCDSIAMAMANSIEMSC